MRVAVAVGLVLLCAAPAAASEPLEKQFFDYFTQRCEAAMEAEWKAANLDPANPEAHEVMVKYCACTSQAVVSFLNAEEIISFATNPEQEPAASKMRPHFVECQERARKKVSE
ncbi:MAG TPA: hypothetical protein VGQ35_14710 [Dongiaceae bacterium]|jgi:hypothetical protein|nr:hypothetical protein [Dongiaceae bacterium]